MRDRDEWRRPWPDGPEATLGLPSRSSEVPERAAETRTGTSYTAVRDTGMSRGLEGAFDLAADTAVRPSETALAAPATTVGPASRVRRRGGFLPGALGGIVASVAVLGALVGFDVLALNEPGRATVDRPLDTAAPAANGFSVDRAPLPDGSTTLSAIPDVADRVLPSVVRINASGAVDLTGTGSLGSGVIYRSDGYIITNEHVIQGASAVEVLLSDGDRFEAEVVGVDALNDLAVLRIGARGLPAVDLRPTDDPIRVGETVVAVGSPFGFDATVTAGIVSALNRDLRLPNSSDVIPAVIQTDAAINPGNSGGPLVDLQGRLVGINTAIVSRTGTNEGLGFAVPVRQAMVSADQIIAQGFVRYPLLGITGTDVSPQVAERLGLTNRRGAVIESVQPGSGADVGGIRTGDVVVAVDGIPLRSMGDLVAEVRRRAPGMTVVFEVLRDGAELEIEVVLGERPRT